MEENENVESVESTSSEETQQQHTEPETYTKEQVTQLIKQRVDRLNGKIEEAEKRAKSAEDELSTIKAAQERDAAARRIAADNNVPYELLRGSTEEELLAHAQQLSPYFKHTNNEGTASEGFAPAEEMKSSNRDRFAAALEGIL